jgi:hypothetical protein
MKTTRQRYFLPLRKVVFSILMWEGNSRLQGNVPGNRHFRRERLECGHETDSSTKPAKARRCFDCRTLIVQNAPEPGK